LTEGWFLGHTTPEHDKLTYTQKNQM